MGWLKGFGQDEIRNLLLSHVWKFTNGYMAPEDQAASHHPNRVIFYQSVGFLEPPPTADMGGSSFPWIMVASVHLPSIL